MRRYLIFFLAISQLCACNLLKRTDSTVNKSHASQSGQMQMSSLQENNRLITSASNTLEIKGREADYRVQFWPKGNFTFSPQGGFSGTADSVIVSGRSATHTAAAASAAMKIQDKGKTKTSYAHQEKTVLDLSEKKKSSSPSWKLLLPAIVLLLLLAGYVIRKLKRFLNLKFKS